MIDYRGVLAYSLVLWVLVVIITVFTLATWRTVEAVMMASFFVVGVLGLNVGYALRGLSRRIDKLEEKKTTTSPAEPGEE